MYYVSANLTTWKHSWKLDNVVLLDHGVDILFVLRENFYHVLALVQDINHLTSHHSTLNLSKFTLQKSISAHNSLTSNIKHDSFNLIFETQYSMIALCLPLAKSGLKALFFFGFFGYAGGTGTQ